MGSLTVQVIFSVVPVYHTVPDAGEVIVIVGCVAQIIVKELLLVDVD
jgi:hypothetical protein